jgi:hypothetical protein
MPSDKPQLNENKNIIKNFMFANYNWDTHQFNFNRNNIYLNCVHIQKQVEYIKTLCQQEYPNTKRKNDNVCRILDQYNDELNQLILTLEHKRQIQTAGTKKH